jgi:hypothetical protein
VTRDEALHEAIEAATRAGTTANTDWMAAAARLALAWVAIHDRLPEARPDPVTAQCGHNVVAMWTGSQWVHPSSMAECEMPPVSDD